MSVQCLERNFFIDVYFKLWLISFLFLISEVSVTQRHCAANTNTTVKNVEVSRRHTRGEYTCWDWMSLYGVLETVWLWCLWHRMRVKKLPMILALHLKRFKYMEQLQRYTKLSYRVVFPLELRLFNTSGDATNPERLYDLVAVVVHCGRCVGAHTHTQQEQNTFMMILAASRQED